MSIGTFPQRGQNTQPVLQAGQNDGSPSWFAAAISQVMFTKVFVKWFNQLASEINGNDDIIGGTGGGMLTGAPLVQGSLIPNPVGIVYTSPTSTRIDAVTLANVSVNSRKVTLYKVPSGQAIAAQYIIAEEQVNAGESVRVPELEGHWLFTGDTIQALADVTNVVNIFISGGQSSR